MKKITQCYEYLTDKSRLSKKILIITTLCCAFNLNAQLREVYNQNNWGFTGGNPQSLFEYDSKMYFTAGYFSSSDRRIFRATGVGAIQGLSNTVAIGNDFATVGYKIINSELYFDGHEPNGEMKIYKAVSSSTNPVEILNMTALTGSTSSRFIDPVVINNKIIFTPFDASGGVGIEPYVIDLSNSANNGLFIDINNGAASSDPRYFTVFNNEIYFSATETTNGRELWKTDGTSGGTVLFSNLNFGFGNSDPDQFMVVGANMIFAATNAVTGRELFITDGTSAGTTILKNINPSGGDSNPTNLTKIGSEVYFSATNGTDGIELWKTDGTELGTVMVKDINPTGDSFVKEFLKVGSTIFFQANDGTNGHELWKTDGTTIGTILVKDIRTVGNGLPSYLTEYNGKLYFKGTNDSGLHDLWVSDGTPSGTQQITNSTASGSHTENLFVFDNELYFKYREAGTFSLSLWAYMDPALGINDVNVLDNQISLFPNPTNNYFEIESTSTIDRVEIYSLQGQFIKSFTFQNQYDISELSSGIYFVKIQATNSEVTKRIIKE